MRSVDAIAFDYAPSRWPAAALIGGTLVAVVATFASGFDFWIACVLAAVCLAYAGWQLTCFMQPCCDHITWHAAGDWRLSSAEAMTLSADLVSARTLGPFVLLVLRVGARRTAAMPLLPDNCTADVRRRLRVRLKRGVPPT